MQTDPLLAAEYAPTGVLRVALNHGNRVLVGRDAERRPMGITVDIARLLAETVGLPLKLVEFPRAIDVSDAAERDSWDVCFLAVDPKRAETIAFTAPYVRINGCYVVAPGVEANSSEAVVARGLRVGTAEGSAYTLHLSRQAGAEHLVVLPDIAAAFAALDAGRVDAVAGIEQAMAAEAALRPGAQVVQPPFMQINQAMGMPATRTRAIAHLRGWVADRLRDGSIGTILERQGVSRSCAVLDD